MSNETKTTGGEHNAERPYYERLETPIEKPIKIVWDEITCKIRVGDKIETMEVDRHSLPKNLQSPCIYLSIPEFNRGLESYIDYLNQTKNDGRLEARTIKDRENQKIVDAIILQAKYRRNRGEPPSLYEIKLHEKIKEITDKDFEVSFF